MKYIKLSSNKEIAVDPMVITDDSPILSVNRISGVSSISRGGRKHKDSTLIRTHIDNKSVVIRMSENDSMREITGYLFPVSITGPVGTTFKIDWGDGNTTTHSIAEASVIGVPDGWSVGGATHEYAHVGTYNIEIYDVSSNYYGLGGALVDVSSSKSYVSGMFDMPGYISPSGTCDIFNKKVTDIIIGSQVSRLENYALCQCFKLKHIYIDRPESINYIGDYALYYNPTLDLASTVLPQLLNQSSNTYIGESAFSISVYDLHNELTQIPLEIPEGVTTIGESVFRNTVSRRFNKLYIPDSVVTIEADSFTFGYYLTSIRIGKTTNSELTTIRGGTREGGFACCTSCRELTIWSNKLTSIASGTFSKLLSCNTINMHASVAPTLGTNVFYRAGELAVKRGETCVLHVPVGATGYDEWMVALGSDWSIAYDL